MSKKHIRIFLMSMDTETGKQRRDRIHKWNKNQGLKEGGFYERYAEYAITDINLVCDRIKNKMKKPYNLKEDIWNKKCLHFQHYISLLQKIVDEKLNHIVICEDDALVRHPGFIFFGRVENLDGPIILGSKLHHPTSWKLDTKKYFDENISPCIDEFTKSENNNIHNFNYNKYRWSCSACIYYPHWEDAKKILDFYNNDKKQLTWLDLWMSKNKLIKYLYYPSVFEINDDGLSQLNTSAGGVIYNYKIHNYGTL